VLWSRKGIAPVKLLMKAPSGTQKAPISFVSFVSFDGFTRCGIAKSPILRAGLVATHTDGGMRESVSAVA
jgi:hypothetical protein